MPNKLKPTIYITRKTNPNGTFIYNNNMKHYARLDEKTGL